MTFIGATLLAVGRVLNGATCESPKESAQSTINALAGDTGEIAVKRLLR
jgi:hypothetical protein